MADSKIGEPTIKSFKKPRSNSADLIPDYYFSHDLIPRLIHEPWKKRLRHIQALDDLIDSIIVAFHHSRTFLR
jgi:hypothetical protein